MPVATLNRYARLAGALYLTIIVTSFLSLIFVESRLVVDGDAAATAGRIAANPTLYRVGLVYDLVMFAGVVALSWALFVILRGVDRNRALLGLLWRMAEAVVGAVTVLLGVVTVLLVSDKAFEPEERHALVEVLVTARGIGFDVTIFFLGLGSIVFCRLLYRSRYIPRWLSGLGVAAYVIIVVGVVVSLLFPQTKDVVMVMWGPGVVFEAGAGGWLLVKGIRGGRPGVSVADRETKPEHSVR